jgi:glycerophosphoryl diester phosphodiesterase
VDPVTLGDGHLRPLLSIVLASLLLGSASAAAANPFLREAGRPSSIFNIAHAGASSIAPQNTLAAGRTAFELGADVWGIDVRLTGDDVFVLMHDETLDRTTDVEEVYPTRAPWRVEDFTLDEIRRLDAGSWFLRDDPFGQIEAGRLRPAELESYAGEPVPTLREALEFVAEHRWLLDIEVKPTANLDAEEVSRHLLDLIEETGTAGRVMISSFDNEILRSIRSFDPVIPIGALTIFAPLDPVAYLDDLRADVYLPSLVGFTEDLLKKLSDAGIGVHVWTYNTEDQLERLARTPGITGIYTDFPQRLDAVLERLSHAGDE